MLCSPTYNSAVCLRIRCVCNPVCVNKQFVEVGCELPELQESGKHGADKDVDGGPAVEDLREEEELLLVHLTIKNRS